MPTLQHHARAVVATRRYDTIPQNTAPRATTRFPVSSPSMPSDSQRRRNLRGSVKPSHRNGPASSGSVRSRSMSGRSSSATGRSATPSASSDPPPRRVSFMPLPQGQRRVDRPPSTCRTCPVT
ncbi:hypothetical protein ACFQY7_11800 [Actinomadura luteofluorescens]|uniref:hypothetical protein n=1 Tax=Actinomadura luteofluorescens TaxID=46163 RepID=UPI003629E2CA